MVRPSSIIYSFDYDNIISYVFDYIIIIYHLIM